MRVLEHLGLPSSPPPLDPPRRPSDLELGFDIDHDGNVYLKAKKNKPQNRG